MITVTKLEKSYGNTKALNGIDFHVSQGEFFGLLGPNGAGKTTTLSILSTLLQADSGSVSVNKLDIITDKKKCKKCIGIVPQDIALYQDLSAIDNMKFWGSIYKVPSKLLDTRIDELLNLFGLSERKNEKIKKYSGGMKRRINFACAILHNPKILLLDEPTVGIDPQSRNLIYEVLEKLHREGMTIVYTTHNMDEAEKLCNRIGIIDNGNIIANGTLNELYDMSNLKTSIRVSASLITDNQKDALMKQSKDTYVDGNDVIFSITDEKTELVNAIQICNHVAIKINTIDIQKPNLETVFLKLTGKKLRD